MQKNLRLRILIPFITPLKALNLLQILQKIQEIFQYTNNVYLKLQKVCIMSMK